MFMYDAFQDRQPYNFDLFTLDDVDAVRFRISRHILWQSLLNHCAFFC